MPKIRTPAQEERDIAAKGAWAEYLGERAALEARTAKLKAMRLAAQASKPDLKR